MAKRSKQTRKKKTEKGFGIGAILVLAVFIISIISSLLLLWQRIPLIIGLQATIGVWVSFVLLLIYFVFLLMSVYLMTLKRRSAIKMSLNTIVAGVVFIIWYDIIGIVIFYGGLDVTRLLEFFINAGISLVIFFYIKNSKRVKEIFVG